MDPIRRWVLAVRNASITAISLFAITTNLAYAQNAEAIKRFHDAEMLNERGKIEEACALFEESNRIEPRAATLIYIGRCKEKLGKLASALAAFRDALARVKDPAKKEMAMNEAAKLEPRVSRLTVSVVQETRVEGLAVLRDGQPIDAADYSRAIPIDGGSYEIAASAPGYQRWSTSIRVAPEGDKASVTVPALVTESRMKEASAIKEDIQPTPPNGESAGRPALKEDMQVTPPTRSVVRTAFKAVGYILLGGGVFTAMYAVTVSAGRSGGERAYIVGLTSIPLGVVTLYFAYPSRGKLVAKQPPISKSDIGKRKRHEFAVTPLIGPKGGGAALHFVW